MSEPVVRFSLLRFTVCVVAVAGTFAALALLLLMMSCRSLSFSEFDPLPLEMFWRYVLPTAVLAVVFAVIAIVTREALESVTSRRVVAAVAILVVPMYFGVLEVLVLIDSHFEDPMIVQLVNVE